MGGGKVGLFTAAGNVVEEERVGAITGGISVNALSAGVLLPLATTVWYKNKI